MKHDEIMKKINNLEIDEEVRKRGKLYSNLEAIQNILITKGIITESEYNKYYDESLERNFQLE